MNKTRMTGMGSALNIAHVHVVEDVFFEGSNGHFVLIDIEELFEWFFLLLCFWYDIWFKLKEFNAFLIKELLNLIYLLK